MLTFFISGLGSLASKNFSSPFFSHLIREPLVCLDNNKKFNLSGDDGPCIWR
jgi:hypothetical protein